ncbi:MAG: hypothetical protein O7H41_16965 [Planctomycetota bacterium]|nr:hypothetical protein [Planctomycetota bacterium]
MVYRYWHFVGPLLVQLLLPLLAFSQEQASPEKQSPKDQSPKPRLGLHSDPLPEGAIARLGTVRFRHAGTVYSVAFSSDGKVLATSGSDYSIRIWDVAAGKERARFVGHRNVVSSVAFSPDGKRLVSGGHDDTIRIWDADTGKAILRINGPNAKGKRLMYGGVSSVAFAPDGLTIASGHASNEIHLWDAVTGRELLKIDGPRAPNPTQWGIARWAPTVAFSPDGTRLAYGSGDRSGNETTIRIYDVRRGQELAKLEGHDRSVASIAFSPDGKILASGSQDATIRLWDVAFGRQVRKIDAHRPSSPVRAYESSRGVASVVFSPDGKTLASGGFDNTLRVWEVATGTEKRSFRGHVGPVTSVAFSPNGKTLASGSAGGNTGIWDYSVRLWDVATGEPIHRPEGHVGSVVSVTFAPDGRTLATGGSDGTVRLWDASSGKELRKIDGPGSSVESVAISPDGGLLIASGGIDVPVWDIASGKELIRLKGPSTLISGVAFSPNGRTIASGAQDGTVQFWEVETGRRGRVLHGHNGYVWTIAFSPDGKRLASAGFDQTIQIWEVATGKKIRHFLAHDGPVASLVFSLAGQVIASTSGDGTVRLWNIESGEEVLRLTGNRTPQNQVAISPDGKILAAPGSRGEVSLWEVATGKKILSVWPRGGWPLAIAFSPDGKRLISGHSDTTALLWDLSPKDWTGDRARRLERKDLESLWEDLAGEDSHKAYKAIWVFSEAGDGAIAYLGDRLSGVGSEDPDRIRLLISKLGHADFEMREAAHQELRRLGSQAGPALREALEGASSPEVRERLEAVLGTSGPTTPWIFPSDSLRQLRVIQALERAGSRPALELLEKIARDSPSARTGETAAEALARFAASKVPVEAVRPMTETVGGARARLAGRIRDDGEPGQMDPIARLGSGRFRHLGTVLSLDYSPDGKTLVSAGRDGTVRVWEVATGQQFLKIDAGESVNCVAFSPDGKMIAAGGAGAVPFDEMSRLGIWDVSSGEEITRLRGLPAEVQALAFSPDGKTLAAGGGDPGTGSSVHIWDVESGRHRLELASHGSGVTAVAISPDGSMLASASWDRTILIWDLATGDELRKLELRAGENAAYGLAFSPDGKTLASANYDRTVRLWDPRTGKVIRELEGHGSTVFSVAFSRDGKILAADVADLKLFLWDPETGKLIREIDRTGGATRSIVHRAHPVAFSPDGETLASAGGDSAIHFWDLRTGRELQGSGGHDGYVCAVTFSPDGRTLASAGGDSTIRLWDLGSREEIRELLGHREGVCSLAFSPDGKTLASGSMDETVRLWEVPTGDLLRFWPLSTLQELLKGPQKGAVAFAFTPRHIISLALSPDGRHLLAAGSDHSAFLLDTRTGDKRVISKGIEEPMGRVRIRIAGNKPHKTFSLDFLYDPWDETTAITPDGSALIFRSDEKTIQVSQVETGEKYLTIVVDPVRRPKLFDFGAWRVACLSLSPDGRALAIGTAKGMIQIWEMATGKQITSWQAHPELITSLAFSPDGQILASASQTETIRLWDWTTAAEIQTLVGHEGWVLSVAFSPDGKTLASGGLDNSVLLWDSSGASRNLPRYDERPRPSLLDGLWSDLAGEDAGQAYDAIFTLAAAAETTVPFLEDRISPASTGDAGRFEELIEKLDSDQFAVREEALGALEKSGASATAALRGALESTLSPEVRTRIRTLLDTLTPPFREFPSEPLRSLRAIQVLERIGSNDARDLLEALASGSPHALQRREAKAALERLEGRGSRQESRPRAPGEGERPAVRRTAHE